MAADNLMKFELNQKNERHFDKILHFQEEVRRIYQLSKSTESGLSGKWCCFLAPRYFLIVFFVLLCTQDEIVSIAVQHLPMPWLILGDGLEMARQHDESTLDGVCTQTREYPPNIDDWMEGRKWRLNKKWGHDQKDFFVSWAIQTKIPLLESSFFLFNCWHQPCFLK